MAKALRHAAPRPAVRRRQKPRPRAAGQIDFYFPEQVDNSRLVKFADPTERSSQHRLVLLSVVLLMFILGAAYLRFATIRAGYRIEELKSQKEQLLEANRQLRLEEATLRNPERIDSIARTQLGFVAPKPGQLVRLENVGADSDGAVVARVLDSQTVKPASAPTAP